jgi:hypothetical protein
MHKKCAALQTSAITYIYEDRYTCFCLCYVNYGLRSKPKGAFYLTGRSTYYLYATIKTVGEELNLFLHIIKHHATKTRVGVEVGL